MTPLEAAPTSPDDPRLVSLKDSLGKIPKPPYFIEMKGIAGLNFQGTAMDKSFHSFSNETERQQNNNFSDISDTLSLIRRSIADSSDDFRNETVSVLFLSQGSSANNTRIAIGHSSDPAAEPGRTRANNVYIFEVLREVADTIRNLIDSDVSLDTIMLLQDAIDPTLRTVDPMRGIKRVRMIQAASNADLEKWKYYSYLPEEIITTVNLAGTTPDV